MAKRYAYALQPYLILSYFESLNLVVLLAVSHSCHDYQKKKKKDAV